MSKENNANDQRILMILMIYTQSSLQSTHDGPARHTQCSDTTTSVHDDSSRTTCVATSARGQDVEVNVVLHVFVSTWGHHGLAEALPAVVQKHIQRY